MPEVLALPALLPIQLEVALVLWLRAKRGGILTPDVTIVGGHEPGDAPPVPWVSVYSTGARTHPDFAGITGAGLPKICTVDFSMRVHKSVDFYKTASRWAAELYALLADGSAVAGEKTEERAEFRGLMADLNVGGPFHPSDGLHIDAVGDAEESLSMQAHARLMTFGIEFTAQPFDGA